MNTRLVITYCLLLLIPSLILGISGFVLLQHETERWEQHEERAANAQAQLVVERIQLFTEAVQQDLTSQLLPHVPTTAQPDLNQLANQLAAIDARSLPLSRQLFLWRSPNVLLYPDPTSPATGEQSRFVRRYVLLFSGQVPWDTPAADQPQSPTQALSPSSSYNITRFQARNRIAYEQQDSQAQQYQSIPQPEALTWKTWYADNQLHMIGWTRLPGTTAIAGVEVEMMAFLGGLLPALAEEQPLHGTAVALIDGTGNTLFRSHELPTGATPNGTCLVGDQLPHWRVDVYPTAEATAQTPWLTIAAFAMLGLLISAIILGSTLIAIQSHRDRSDATRKTTFVSNVSHELKTPLTTIRMYAEMLAENRVKSEKQPRYLQTIVDESQRLTRLVNNVLDFSRIEQNRKNYHSESINVGQLAQLVIDTHQIRFAALDITLDLDLPDLHAYCDRDALEQVLINLIDNAVKYAANGHYLAIHLAPHHGHVTLTVSDRGPGIPKAHATRVFDPFHRVDDALTATTTGTGLGLSISRRLLREQRGDLTYQPAQPTGATFIVTLPTGAP